MNQDQNNFFQAEGVERHQQQSPLANRVCPQGLDDYVRQEPIIGSGRPRRRSIDHRSRPAVVLAPLRPSGYRQNHLGSIIANTSSCALTHRSCAVDCED